MGLIAIKRIKNKTSFSVMALIVIAALLILTFTFKESSDGELLYPSPSYSTVNRWVGENGRTSDLCNKRITDYSIFYHNFEDAPTYGSRLIIYSENMGIAAYTSGKMLFESSAEYGSRYNIIPIDELTDGGTLYLHLKPVEKMTGSINAPLKITTQNDFILSLIKTSILQVSLIAALLIILCVVITFAFKRLPSGDRSHLKSLYLCTFILLLIPLIAAPNGLMQFAVGSSSARYVIHYFSLMLISVPLAAYITALLKTRSAPVEALQIIITAYSLLRLLLFFALKIPLERGITVSYLMIAAQAIILIAYGLRHAPDLSKR